MNFKAYVGHDGNVYFPGIDTGVTKVVCRNPKRKIIAFKTAGHTSPSGQSQIYGPAHYTVYEYELLGTFDRGDRYGIKSSGIVIELNELFGVLRWDVRGKK
jgi:hypothetical protein